MTRNAGVKNGNRIRLLLLEDNEDDEQLLLLELRRAGYQVYHRRVQSPDHLRQALADEPWDIIISDYSMPQFDAPAALAIVKEHGVDIPFIIASGTVGEETAVEALHAGAADFLVKTRLARLAPAIERGMRDAAARRAHRLAEQERIRLEEQLRHAQKMEAVGRLAGGIAHDFNNVLTAIIATADLALESNGLQEEVKSDLRSIRDAGHRAAAITRQLLTFSRKQVVQRRQIDLNEVVQRAEPLLRRLVPSEIALSCSLEATGTIEADVTQMEQVLVNLVVNAADATPAGGTISVSTADLVTTQSGNDNGKVLPPGPYVVLRVRDTGQGMDEATASKIFEPFFTTKEAGRGTGLGLATVYGIVNQSGGHIVVDSRPGEGALFEICLPRLASDEKSATPAPERSTPTELHGSEALLVVEDEAAVRAPMCRSLRQLGYYVLEAKNGEDALTVLHEYHAPIHLLVSDVVMPEMGGAELVRLLRDWYPHLEVLFVSGYSEEMVAAQGALVPNSRYLAKPFTGEQLAAAVRDILDQRYDRSAA